MPQMSDHSTAQRCWSCTCVNCTKLLGPFSQSHPSNLCPCAHYFQHRTKECLLVWFQALPQKTAELVYDGHELDQEALVVELIKARIFSMQSELIELKVWACICAEVMNYTRGWRIYVWHLTRCHPPDHQCSKPVPRLVKVPRPPPVPDNLNHRQFWASTTAYRLGSAAAESDFSSNSAVYPSSGLRRRSQQSSSQEL